MTVKPHDYAVFFFFFSLKSNTISNSIQSRSVSTVFIESNNYFHLELGHKNCVSKPRSRDIKLFSSRKNINFMKAFNGMEEHCTAKPNDWNLSKTACSEQTKIY